MNEISKKGLLNLDCMTVTERLGENIKDCVNKNPECHRPIDNHTARPRYRYLKGKPGARFRRVKRSAVAPEMLKHEGPQESLTVRKTLLQLSWAQDR